MVESAVWNEFAVATVDPGLGQVEAEQGLCWFDVAHLLVEGRGWPTGELARPYDRLPARAEGVVREPVWHPSRQNSGVSVRFVTDAPRLSVRWTVTEARSTATHTDGHVNHARRRNAIDCNANLRAAYQRLQDANVANLHYVPCDDLLGDDDEATVDGTHPTDLGFTRMATVFEPVLRKLI